MYTPGKLDAVMDSDFGLGFLPIPKRTLFADDKQALSEDDDSGLGMECAVDMTTGGDPSSPMMASLLERPFACFSPMEIRRPKKRSERSMEPMDESARKRPRFAERRTILQKSLSFGDKPLGDQEQVKDVVGRMVEESNLIGDGSQTCSLPTIPGKHPDLKSITNQTVVDVISGKYDDTIGSFLIVDCRYPYEYNGGHVPGAINAHRPEDIPSILSQHQSMRTAASDKRHIVIFYCEFSSERGPRMCRNVRKADRDLNKDSYPFLNFPEIYVMHNGFKDFYETHQNLCEPLGYTPMLHKDHSEDLRHFRSKSKSWSGGSRRRVSGLRLF
uniref:M-phase inducer phosphatase n=1 Tax=Magallana gigas TaxID=29159 RepID=K1QR93_MAGGI|eukprot:XP_011450517.1 PREDICTED: M-phase inducer phosphatase 1 [Crassostrea gigas]